MRTKGIMQTKKDERREKILTEAYRIFVEKKIEPVSMGEIAEAAGIGRATLFRYYSSKLELVIAVCTREWKAYLDALDQVRPISSVGEIPAIGRLILHWTDIMKSTSPIRHCFALMIILTIM